MTHDTENHFIGGIGIWPLLIMIAGGLTYRVFSPAPTALHDPQATGWVRIIVFGGSYLLAGILVLTRSWGTMAVSRRIWLYFAMVTLMIASATWSLFPLKVFMNVVHSMGLFFVAVSTAMYAATRQQSFFFSVAMLTAAVLLASVAVVLIFPGFGIEVVDQYTVSTNRWVGVTDHPNTLGATASISICCSLVTLYNSPTTRRKILAVAAIVLAYGVLVFGSRSMTAILSIFLITVSFPILMTMRHDSPRRRLAKISGLGLLGVFVVFIAIMAAPDAAWTDAFFRLIGRNKTLTGRTYIWKYAFFLIGQKPWFGWSFDSLSSARGITYGTMQYSQFHNGYLDLTVRGGIAGIALLLLMLVRSVRTAFRQMRVSFIKGAGTLSLLCLAMISNLAEATFVIEGSPLWFLFISSWVCAEGDVYLAAKRAKSPQAVLAEPPPAFRPQEQMAYSARLDPARMRP